TPTALPALHPGPGEGLVVDEADLGEAVEEPLREVGGHVAPGELVAQLLAAPGLAGQRIEQDLASHRLRVGVGTLRHPVRRWRRGLRGTPCRTGAARH